MFIKSNVWNKAAGDRGAASANYLRKKSRLWSTAREPMECNTLPPYNTTGRTKWDEGTHGNTLCSRQKSLCQLVVCMLSTKWSDEELRNAAFIYKSTLLSTLLSLQGNVNISKLPFEPVPKIFYICLTLAVVPCSQHLECRMYPQTVQPVQDEIMVLVTVIWTHSLHFLELQEKLEGKTEGKIHDGILSEINNINTILQMRSLYCKQHIEFY